MDIIISDLDTVEAIPLTRNCLSTYEIIFYIKFLWKNEVYINVHGVELNKFPISKQLMALTF